MSACLLQNKRSVLLTSYKAGAMALALLCIIAKANGQNLVPNPSFEEYTDCPIGQGTAYYAHPWFNPLSPTTVDTNGAVDYYNACVPFPMYAECSVPQSGAGFQYARTGVAYMSLVFAIIQDSLFNGVYEHLSVKLLSKLSAGKKYCFEMYLSKADYFNCIGDQFGAYFSADTIITPGFYTYIPVTPQIETPPYVFYSDTVNWQKVEGSFIADGGEQFLTIGCFKPPNQLHLFDQAPFPNSCNGSYIWIDDVSVYLCDSTISVNENPVENINLYPNPSTGIFTIQHTFTKQAQLSVYNAVGSLVYEQQIPAGSQNPEINISNFNNGIYLIRVNTPTQILLNERLLIAK
jgi:hypothetical protein